MKAKIIREDIEISPSAVLTDDEQAQTVERIVWRNGENSPAIFWKPGAIVERADCYMLCRLGVAEPADEECQRRAAMTAEQYREAQHASRRLAAGIHPDDFPLYDGGMIVGYNPDGTYTPGPNWHLMPDDTDEDEDE